MSDPKLRVRSSNYGGSGYCIPTTIDQATGKPLKLPGVTTVLNALPKPGTIQWAVDNTVAYCIANLDQILNLEDSVAYHRFRWYHTRKPDVDAQDANPYNAHAGALNDAAELGTFIHEWIEAHVQGLIEPDPVNEMHEEMIGAYLTWEQDHDVEPIAVEATVVNEEYGYAGTLDGIWLIDGVPTLLDTKSSKAVYDSHIAQLAALSRAEYMMVEVGPDEGTPYTAKGQTTYWTTTPIPEYDRVGILKVRFDDFNSKGEFIPAEAKFTGIETGRLEAGWGLFTAALTMKHAEKEWKDYERAYGSAT